LGQQQILLIVLVTILVGIATIIAINTIGDMGDSVNETQVYQSLNEMAGDAQAYYHKSRTLGGGGRSYEGITFNHLNVNGQILDNEGLIFENQHGQYQISERNLTNFSIFASIGGDSTNQVEGIFSPGSLVVSRVVKKENNETTPEPETPTINNKWRR